MTTHRPPPPSLDHALGDALGALSHLRDAVRRRAERSPAADDGSSGEPAQDLPVEPTWLAALVIDIARRPSLGQLDVDELVEACDHDAVALQRAWHRVRTCALEGPARHRAEALITSALRALATWPTV